MIAELVTQHLDYSQVEITWSIPYLWSRPMSATRIDPPEGGLELNGGAFATKFLVVIGEVPILIEGRENLESIDPNDFGVTEEMMWETVYKDHAG